MVSDQGKTIMPAELLWNRSTTSELREVVLETFDEGTGKFPHQVPALGFINRKGQTQNFSFGNRIITAAYPFTSGHTVVRTSIPIIDEDD